MKRSGMPQWLFILLVLAAVVFLGPPALALLAGLVGVAIGIAALTLKLGLVVLAVYAVVLLFKAVFGGPDRQPAAIPQVDHEAALERDDEELRRLDEELARVIASQKSV